MFKRLINGNIELLKIEGRDGRYFPHIGSPRYLEVRHADLDLETFLPKINVHSSASGYVAEVSFHPALKLGTYLIDLHPGKLHLFNPEFKDVKINKAGKDLPYICRIYLLEGQVT